MFNETVCNEGSAWGLVNNPTLIKAASVVMLFLVAYVWYNTKGRMARCGLSLIFVGGLANLVERFYFGCVIDHWKPFVWWPTFNAADVVIVLGVLLLLAGFFSAKKPGK